VAQLDVSSALESLDLLALAENRTRPDRVRRPRPRAAQLDQILNQLDQMTPLLQPEKW
jgi:hypothetical protein